MTLSPEFDRAFEGEWARLAAPGATLTGAQRIELAAIARAARSDPAWPAAGVGLAAATIAAAPTSIREPWVEEMGAAIGFPTYVEVTAVVARLSAVDTVTRALGLHEMALPDPVPGDPTAEIDNTVSKRGSWVPTTGGASILFALSAVPAEMEAQEIMSGPLYMTTDEMADPAHPGVITRAQKELVASRTSAINECFY